MSISRSEAFQDSDDVVCSPALAPVAMLVVAFAWLLQWLVPLDAMAALERAEDVDPLWAFLGGGALATGGLCLSIAGYFSMKRHAGDIEPWQTMSVLVTDGAYAWTRNPCYLGLWFALTGIAFAFALDWLLIVTIPAAAIVSRCVVSREEKFLEGRFGRAYLTYKHHVPRYLFIR